ncbi:MAG: hypothetical protein LBD04_00910 [Synergistaceae bacterium]|nr:hypothetical protein [Synergistaceae bacterium]
MFVIPDIVHVVLAVYDPQGSYARHGGVVMASIFERTRSPVCVHILHDQTLTAHNRALLEETAGLFGQTAAFHDVSPHVERIGDDIASMVQNRFSLGSLFRLLLPDVLPLDKVIYLDCDVVVNVDIQELWDVPLDGCSLGGVLDRPAGESYRRFSSKAFRLSLMGCDRRIYVNSGVLVMDLERIRKRCRLIQQSAAWVRRYRHCADMPDQDLINSCFRGDIKILESRFNNGYAHLNSKFRNDLHDATIANSILHGMLTPKPWETLRGSVVDRLYWRAFLKTPWGRLSPEELVDLMIDVSEKSPLTHRRSRQCYQTVLFRLKRDIFLWDGFVIAWLFAKNLYHGLYREMKNFLSGGMEKE